ncbi:biotin--[acetyl-CoA-carboxylase] ligase [bacterium]|nr:biotin--[acetyl-CoA-carboxylase] ligase [bacterium]
MFNTKIVEEELGRIVPNLSVKWKAETISTNLELLDTSKSAVSGWKILIADMQTGGKGRHQRTWVSPKGGLYFSIRLNLKKSASPITLVPLVVGLAVREGIQNCHPEENDQLNLLLKWPNDILSNGNKLAGILCESMEDKESWQIVAGIGINIEPLPLEIRYKFPYSPTSLYEEGDAEWEREQLVVQIVTSLQKFLQDWETNPERIREQWWATSGIREKNLYVRTATEVVSGIAKGLTEDGGLLIDSGDKITTIHSAEGIEEHNG